MMDGTVTRQIGSFKAIDESKNIYTILEYQDFILSTQFGKQTPDELPGMKSLRTPSGDHVNRIDENTYDIFGGMGAIRVKKI